MKKFWENLLKICLIPPTETRATMELQPAEIRNLRGSICYVKFNVSGWDTSPDEYRRVIRELACACANIDPALYQPAATWNAIPFTVVGGNPHVCVLHVVGHIDRETLDNYFLIMRGSIYFQAADGDEGWRQVTLTEAPIAGAGWFDFDGSYTEVSDGIENKSIKLGFIPLINSIIGIVKCKPNPKKYFYNFCVNICEAVRSTTIADFVASTMDPTSPNYFSERCLAGDITMTYLIRYWGHNSDCARTLRVLDEVRDREAWQKAVTLRPVCQNFPDFCTLDNLHEHYAIFRG